MATFAFSIYTPDVLIDTLSSESWKKNLSIFRRQDLLPGDRSVGRDSTKKAVLKMLGKKRHNCVF